MRRCDREEIDPPWPREFTTHDPDSHIAMYSDDPLLRRAWGLLQRRATGLPIAPWPIVGERVREHLSEWVALP